MKKYIKYTGGLFVLGCACFLFLELFLRNFNPHPEINKNYNPRFLFQKDNLLGYSLTPKFNTVFRNIRIKINSHGLRDREYSYEKYRGVYRVLILGGSNTLGQLVGMDSLFSELIEKRLNILRPIKGIENFEIINAGVAGYGTDQQLLYLKERGLKYNPDLVLLAFNFGDVADNMRDNYTVIDGFLATKGTGFFGNVKRYMHFYSHAYNFLTAKIKSSVILNHILTRFEIVETDPRMLLHKKKLNKAEIKSWSVTEDIIIEMNELCSENNIRFLVAIKPKIYLMKEESWSYLTNEMEKSEKLDKSRPIRMIIKILSNNNIKYLDMTTDFIEEAQKGRVFWWPNDRHWNGEAHKLATELIYEKLVEFIPPS